MSDGIVAGGLRGIIVCLVNEDVFSSHLCFVVGVDVVKFILIDHI